jgi:hypothetical protein
MADRPQWTVVGTSVLAAQIAESGPANQLGWAGAGVVIVMRRVGEHRTLGGFC